MHKLTTLFTVILFKARTRFLFFIFLACTLLACNESKPVRTWEQATQGLYSADLSTDGWSLVASIHHGGSLWRLKDGERIYNWNHSKGTFTDLVDVALSPDGLFGVTADSRRIVLWSTKTGQSAGFWNTPSDILSVAVSDNAQYIFIGMKNFNAIYIDVKQGGILSTLAHESNVRSVAISADGQLGLTGSDDKTAKLWQLETGKQLNSWNYSNAVNYVALSPSGEWAFVSSQHSKAEVWNIAENKSTLLVGSKGASISAVRFSKRENQLVVGNTAREVTLWDINQQKVVEKWIAPKRSMWKPAGARIYALAFGDKSGQLFATSSNGLSYEFHYAVENKKPH